MLVTKSGMLMLSKDMQRKKALSPMLVTESGMLMFFNELHPEKALSRMLVTESGMLIFSKDLHPSKAPHLMHVTESGMLTLFKEDLHTATAGINAAEMISKDSHSAKALSPMLVTESGMAMLSKDLHPAKALSPMLVTEAGMLMLFNDMHPLKALSPIEVHPVKAISSLYILESGITTFTSVWHHLNASLETSVTSWGILTPKKPRELTSSLDAASISLLVYATLTSDSASKPTSFNVWASFSKLLPWNTAILQIFCSTGSSRGNCSRSLAFSCCTVWISATSRARTSPRRVMTFSSGMAIDGSTLTSKIEEKPPTSSILHHDPEIS